MYCLFWLNALKVVDMHILEKNEQQEILQDEVDKRVDRWLGIVRYKKTHPTYILLNGRDEQGYVCVAMLGKPERYKELWAAYKRAEDLGLIDKYGFITKAGIEWLNEPIEL